MLEDLVVVLTQTTQSMSYLGQITPTELIEISAFIYKTRWLSFPDLCSRAVIKI